MTDIFGTSRNDTLVGTSRNDRIYGYAGNDRLSGNSGNDVLYGGNGNDTLSGNNGNDTLVGGAGNDFLVGGAGNNRSTGGSGADTFVFYSNVSERTVITDFNRLQGDRFLLVGFGDITSTSQLSYDIGTGALSYQGVELGILENKPTDFSTSSIDLITSKDLTVITGSDIF
jgi:hypothetical protein